MVTDEESYASKWIPTIPLGNTSYFAGITKMKVSADGRKAGLRYSTVTSSSPERPRIPHSRRYQVTPEGLSIALFLTRVTQRFLIPGLGQLTGTGPPGSPLSQADRAYNAAITSLAQQASIIT